jgi:hypothetical protein
MVDPYDFNPELLAEVDIIELDEAAWAQYQSERAEASGA